MRYLVILLGLIMLLSSLSANQDNENEQRNQSRNFEIVYVGDPDSEVYASSPPFDFSVWWAYAQTIYTAEEINMSGGVIDRIEYTFRSYGDIYEPQYIQIWMMNIGTDFDVFPSNDSWIGWANFTQVYSGYLWVNLPPGIHNVTVNLNTPFTYTGGNIVFMTNRTIDWDNWHQFFHEENGFLQTNHPGENRSLLDGSNATPPWSIDWGYFSTYSANIKLRFNTLGFGKIEGIVTSLGVPIENMEVSIIGTPRSSYTNTAGEYTLLSVTPGVHNLRAYKIEYTPQIVNGVEIEPNETTTQDIIVTAAPEVTVSGRIISSSNNLPLEGANVLLWGGAEFPIVFTDNNGLFTIPNVYINHTYNITINAPEYIEYTSTEIIVGDSDTYINDIMLFEIPGSPLQVTAYLYENEAYISWEAPNSRVLESYNLYKSLVIDHAYPNNWISIISNITETEFIDSEVLESPHGYYYYIVEAVYTNGNISLPTMGAILLSDFVYVGNPTSNTGNIRVPLNFYLRSGVSQAIYKHNELHFEGLITELEYYFTWETVSPRRVIQIWMANLNSEVESFISDTDWIPFEEFTLVYNGFFNFIDTTPFSPIQIYLDEPFYYEGENLVLMTYTPFDENHIPWMQGNRFLISGFNNNDNNVLMNESNSEGVINPEMNILGSGHRLTYFPNTKFYFETSGNEGIRPARYLRASIFDSQVNLTWNSPISYLTPNGYNIYRTEYINQYNEEFWWLLAGNIQGNEYIDPSWVELEGEFVYMVRAVYENNQLSRATYSNRVSTPTSNKEQDDLPLITILYGNYPNPFNPSTIISFDLEKDGNVKIDIYNIKGQKVKSLVNDTFKKGSHIVSFDGTDENGLIVGSGIYFYQMKAGEHVITRKMVLLK